MNKWEKDIEETFEVDKWFKMAQFASKAYNNTSLIEANYNVLLRWYMVPVRVAACVPGTSPFMF